MTDVYFDGNEVIPYHLHNRYALSGHTHATSSIEGFDFSGGITSGQVLMWDGQSNWVPATGAGGGTTETLDILYTDLNGESSYSLFTLPVESVLLGLYIEKVSSFSASASSRIYSETTSSYLSNPFSLSTTGFVSSTVSMWYGSNTSGLPIVLGLYTAGVWSSEGDMGTLRGAPGGCAFPYLGSHARGRAIGGRYGSAHTTYYNTWESYDGTSWSNGTHNLNTARAYCGSIIDGDYLAVLCGQNNGGTLSTCEKYHVGYDIAWTSMADWGVATTGCVGHGTHLAGLVTGGSAEGSKSYEFNGTSWSAGGDMSYSRNSHGGTGAQTDALVFGGGNTSVEQYDGTSWSTLGGTLNSLNTAIASCNGAGSNAGGMAQGSTTCEMYDKTNGVWRNVAGNSTSRTWAIMGGYDSECTLTLLIGGFEGTAGSLVTEEFSSTLEYSFSRGRLLVKYLYM